MGVKYTIYRVPEPVRGMEAKIGCTTDYPSRCYRQGLKDGEFYPLKELEFEEQNHVTNQIAGTFERFYQRIFNVKVDYDPEYGGYEHGLASIASPNHISRQVFTCPRCEKSGKGHRMRGHINKGTKA